MVTPSCQLTAATPRINRPRETRTPCPLESRPHPTRPKFQDRLDKKASSSRRKKRRDRSPTQPPTTSSRQIVPMWIPSTIHRSPNTSRIDETRTNVTILDEQSRRGFEKRATSARIFRNISRVYPPGYLVP